MKNMIKLNSLWLICILLVAGTFSSCDTDEEGNAQVALLSFGPAGVHHGETIKFIGTNLDKVTSIVFRPAVEVSASSFTSRTKDLIEVAVPNEAEAGTVILKTPNGDIETKTPLSFDVDVDITAITAEAKPGTNITISGDKVNWIEEVVFSDDLAVTEFVSKTVSEVVVTVPMAAETGFLTFKTGGTDPLTFASASELVVTLPAVTSFSPSPIKHTENLTINGTNLDLVTSIVFAGNKTVVDFVSKSESQIVVTVPTGTLKGKITLKQASPVSVVTADELTILLPVATGLAPQPAVPGTDNITITGSSLDLVSKLTLPGKTGAIEVLSTSFTTHTATEIVLALPAGADNGGVSYTTIHGYSSTLGVNVIIPGAGPAPLAIVMFDDQVYFGGGNWSWGNTTVTASTEQYYSGTKSWKHTNTGTDGGASVGGMTGVDASGQGVFKFALYGGPGTEGKQVAAILNDNWGNYNSVVLKAGQWTEYSIPLTSYPGVNLTSITRWIFKIEGASAGDYMYVDRVGFDPAGPPPLNYYIYKDGLQNGWAEWNGWGHTTKDFANTEQVFSGTKAIKMTFNDQYGALQFGSPSATAFSGYTTLSFRVYAPAAQNLIVQLNNAADKYLSIPQGWSLVDIPVSELAENTSVSELRIKNNNPTLPVTLYFDEIGLKN
jgi:hypothetical protein